MDYSKTPKPKTEQKTKILPFGLSVVAGVGIILFMLLGTTPDRIGPLGITVFFIVLLFTLFNFGVMIRNGLLKQPGSSSLLFVIVTSVALTGALALNTIELGVGDVVLLVLFVLTFTVYWTKLR